MIAGGRTNVSRAWMPMESVRRQPVAHKSRLVWRRRIGHGVSLIVLCFALALLFVWVRVQVIQFGYEVSRLRKETHDLAKQRSRLEADVATLKSPSRLTRMARNKLGMRLPQGNEIVFVKPSGGGE